VITAYRRHAGPALLTSLAVFLPLNLVRYPLVEARWYPAAIALTLLGHVALVPLLRRRTGPDVPGVGLPAAAAGLVAITALEVLGGRAVEAVVGRSTFGITFGGFLPSVLLGPLWAMLVVGAWTARRERTPAAR
jgi:hypothetical protein